MALKLGLRFLRTSPTPVMVRRWISGLAGFLTCCGMNEFVFFFQAEDGIRDGTVTGVQTCALPIWGKTASQTAFRVKVEGVDESREAGEPQPSRSVHPRGDGHPARSNTAGVERGRSAAPSAASCNRDRTLTSQSGHPTHTVCPGSATATANLPAPGSDLRGIAPGCLECNHGPSS